MTVQTKEEIYKQYFKKVYGYMWGKVQNVVLAEDLTSTVFLKVYEKLDSYDESKAALSTWIFRITHNTLIDYYRVRKVNEEMPEEIGVSGDSVEEEILNSEQLDLLADALLKLPERERDLIVLKYYKGWTLKDIAEKMNMSYANVKLVHNKALMKLRTMLAD